MNKWYLNLEALPRITPDKPSEQALWANIRRATTQLEGVRGQFSYVVCSGINHYKLFKAGMQIDAFYVLPSPCSYTQNGTPKIRMTFSTWMRMWQLPFPSAGEGPWKTLCGKIWGKRRRVRGWRTGQLQRLYIFYIVRLCLSFYL